MSRIQTPETVALSHRDLSVNEYVIGIVDDTVHNGLGDGASLLGDGIDSLIPFAGVILGAENSSTVGAAGLHKFQKVETPGA